MTNSVGQSRHVGHLIIHLKSIYSHAVNSLIVQIQAHMQIFDKHSNTNNSNQYIFIYISQIELEMGIESQRTDQFIDPLSLSIQFLGQVVVFTRT